MDEAKTPLDRAIDLCGGQTALAKKIGRTQQNVAYWRKARKGVPADVASDIEEAVEGKVTRHELRPDVFGQPERAA